MSESNFSKAHKFTAKWEGGLSDHPADRGGITAYGVCIEFLKDVAAKASGKLFLQEINVELPVTRDTIRRLTKAQAEAIFKHEFWEKLGLDRLPYRQALLMYDAAVNHGLKWGVRLSQRGYNRAVSLGASLAEDGLIGPKTIAALQNDTDKLVKSIVQRRRDYFQSIVAFNSSQKVFLKGWLNRANAIEKYALEGRL